MITIIHVSYLLVSLVYLMTYRHFTHSSKLHIFLWMWTLRPRFWAKMFDVGDLPVLTFGNCALKTGMIKWPLKLSVRFYVFSSNLKNMTRFLEHWGRVPILTIHIICRCHFFVFILPSVQYDVGIIELLSLCDAAKKSIFFWQKLGLDEWTK